jgi:hypothetical protein
MKQEAGSLKLEVMWAAYRDMIRAGVSCLGRCSGERAVADASGEEKRNEGAEGEEEQSRRQKADARTKRMT